MILIYLVFFFLILRFTVTLFNFISNPQLTSSGKQYNDKVSILIPARNEAHNIEALLSSVYLQNYQNIEVIVLDDHSEDETYKICQGYANKDLRFIALKGSALPDGWLGKNYACCQMAEIASGEYLLFLDADEIVENGLINNAVHRMKTNRLTLLSLFTNQVMVTLGEKLVVPLMHFLLLNLLPLRLVRLSGNPAFSAASGQFMLFEARNYQQYKWHTMVKDKVVEDIEIMKLVKSFKFRAEALLANGYIKCRMYRNLNQAMDGFSKNMLAGFNYSLPGIFSYIFLIMMGPVAIGYYLNIQLFSFAVSLIILSRIMISVSAGQNPFINILLHPFQMFFLLILSFLSVKKYFSKTIKWKGRTIHT
ncbi:MAG: glycosyltransferase family 2 protein [Flavobacterium sp.]|nr:glycosyltransferase family 2 protein [Pedobacter sp.]